MQHIQESTIVVILIDLTVITAIAVAISPSPDYSFSRIKSTFSATEPHSARQYSPYGGRKSINDKKTDLEVRFRRNARGI